MERMRKESGERDSARPRRAVQGMHESDSPLADVSSRIDGSPMMAAQRRKMQSLFGDAIQRVEEEEPLQGKFETAQRIEEEEPLQGKFETVQRVEEEEPLQGKFATAQRVEEEEPLQGKFEAVQRVEEEEPLQGKFEAASSVQLKEEAAKPNNTGLPDNLKSGIENLSGMSMDNVKVHYNSSQPAQLNALAYAQGTDIHVAPGQVQHLPHEAWHVVQQAQGRVRPTMQMKDGVPVNDDAGLEREADVMGARAVQMMDGQNARLAPVASAPVAALQRRVLTIGQDDAEVRYSQRVLLEDTGMPSGKFEEVKAMRADQPEIIIGHGTSNAIGGKDATVMTNELKQRISKHNQYDLVFFACKTGETPSLAASLNSEIQTNLSREGYEVSIQAPDGIALVLSNRKYLVTDTHPIDQTIRKTAATNALPIIRQAITEALETLLSISPNALTDEDWLKDGDTLRKFQWTKVKVTKKLGNTNYGVFIDAVKKRMSELNTASLSSMEKTIAHINDLEATKYMKLDCNLDKFNAWVEDITYIYIAEGMLQKLQQGGGSTDEVSETTRDLGARWKKAGKPFDLSGSYFV